MIRRWSHQTPAELAPLVFPIALATRIEQLAQPQINYLNTDGKGHGLSLIHI